MKNKLKQNELLGDDNEVTTSISLKSEKPCKKCQIKLSLSKNGILGLGKSLIRYAAKKRQCGHHWHFYPSLPNEPMVQTLGVFLTPDSCEMYLGSDDTNNNTVTGNKNIQINNNSIYMFPLKKDFGSGVLEDFEKEDKNILDVRLHDKTNIDITKQCRYIGIWLTTNAMINFGTELIRLAHNFEEGKTIRIEPSLENEIKQTMGISLTPDSCPLTIECKSFGTIDQCVEEYAQKNK